MIHNAIRYYANLSQGIKRAMGLQGDDEGTSRVGETLQPIFDPFALPEHALHRGEIRCGGEVALAAGGAGTYQKLGVRCGTAERILVVERILCASSVITGWVFAFDTAGFANAITYQALDARTRPSPPSQTLRLSYVVDNTTPGNRWSYGRGPADLPFVWERPGIVLTNVPPNNVLVIRPDTANIEVFYAVVWRERAALPGELNI